MTRSRLLWITPKWPLPANDGARIATRALLREVTRRGLDVELLSVVDPDEQIHEEDARQVLGVMSVTTVTGPQTNPLVSALSSPFTPITMRRFVGDEFRARVLERAHHASCIVYDGLHPAAHALTWARYRSPFAKVPLVYRAHNREAQIWERRAAQSFDQRTLAGFAVGLALRIQEALVRRFEDSVCRAASLVATVSGEDTSEFKAVAGARAVETVPIGLLFPEEIKRQRLPPLRGLPLLFVGRLDWPPNREGLAWFLREVWPHLHERRADASLTIVGSGDGSWLADFASLPGVRFEGRVAETAPYYEAAIAAIIPVFYGGGTRVKVIEACLHGVASIGTAVGVEGVGLSNGKSFCRAETAGQWIELLATVSAESLRTIGDHAFSHARQHFSEEGCGESFVRHLGSILGGRV